MAPQLLPLVAIVWTLPLSPTPPWGSEEPRGENSLGILLRSEIPWISYLYGPGKELIREGRGPQGTLHCPLLPKPLLFPSVGCLPCMPSTRALG